MLSIAANISIPDGPIQWSLKARMAKYGALDILFFRHAECSWEKCCVWLHSTW